MVAWRPDVSFASYNLYRGTLAALVGSVPSQLTFTYLSLEPAHDGHFSNSIWVVV